MNTILKAGGKQYSRWEQILLKVGAAILIFRETNRLFVCKMNCF